MIVSFRRTSCRTLYRWDRLAAVVATIIAAGSSQSLLAQRTVASERPAAASERTTSPLLGHRVTINVTRVPRSAAIDAAAASAKVFIQYQANGVDADNTLLTVHLTGVPLRVALDTILAGTNLRVIVDRTAQLVIVGAQSQAQQGTVTVGGRVTDSASNSGLVGVKVAVQGTQISTLTNDQGHYVLRNVPTGTQTVVARRVGYSAAQSVLKLRDGVDTLLLFRLRRITNVLSEVVTTATGERQRIEVGNSSARLNVDSLRQIAPITSVTDLLDGHVPGLVVTRGSGAPGAPSRVRVRGIGSISASNDPIIIVNGVRAYSNQTTSERDAQFSVLDRIDPSTIETIEVLRGPSASALYGSDASAGVIVITTRRGAGGKTRWKLTTDQQRTTQPQNFPTLYYREGMLSVGNTLGGCPLGVLGCTSTRVTAYNPLADSRLTVLGTGHRQNYTASVSGGSPTLQYALDANTSTDLGVLKMSDADVAYLERATHLAVPRWQRRPQSESRTGGTGRFTMLPIPALSIDLTTSVNRSTRTTTPMSNALGIYQSNAVHPEDSSLITTKIGDFRRRTTYRDLSFLNSVTAKWTPASFVTIAGDAGLQNTSQQSDELLRRGDCLAGVCDDQILGGTFNSNRGRRAVGSVNMNATVRVPSRFGTQLTPVVGFNYVHQNSNNVTVSARDLPLGGSSSNGARAVTVLEDGTTPVQLGLYLSTGVWLFDERLHTEFGTRIDASNALGKQVRPNYPKLDLSYPISRESFFPSSLGSLRLRFAYGHSAKQPDVGATLRSYLSGFGVENGEVVPTEYLATLGNTRLRPERSTELEGGFDWGLFNERMHLSVTPWRKFSRDALVKASPPGSVAGIDSPVPVEGNVTEFTSNIGSVRNAGIELAFDAIAVDHAMFRWNVGATLSRERNTLVKLSPEFNRNLIVPNAAVAGYIYGTRYVEGYPIAGTWLRPATHYADLNGDGAISPSEIVFADSAVFVGGPLPNYKSSFDTQIGLWNGRVLVATHLDYENGMSQANTAALENLLYSKTTLRALNDPSTSLAEQAAYRSGYATVRTLSTLRLQSLSIRVTAPDRFARRLRASVVSVALQGSNLGLWTNYSGADPNVTSSIVGNTISDPGVLPMPRSWGLNVSLSY